MVGESCIGRLSGTDENKRTMMWHMSTCQNRRVDVAYLRPYVNIIEKSTREEKKTYNKGPRRVLSPFESPSHSDPVACHHHHHRHHRCCCSCGHHRVVGVGVGVVGVVVVVW